MREGVSWHQRPLNENEMSWCVDVHNITFEVRVRLPKRREAFEACGENADARVRCAGIALSARKCEIDGKFDMRRMKRRLSCAREELLGVF